jgi:hypothetical protein
MPTNADHVTKTAWASVRPEDAQVGRIIHNYMPRYSVSALDKQGQPTPDHGWSEWTGLHVEAKIIEIGAHWSDQTHGCSGYHVRVQFEVPEQYANREFV